MEWLRNNAGRYNVDAARIAVGGSSAGAAIVLRLAYGETRPRVSIAAVLSWVGGLDGNENILDDGEPALFIVHGADDNSVPVSEAYDGFVAFGTEISGTSACAVNRGIGRSTNSLS